MAIGDLVVSEGITFEVVSDFSVNKCARPQTADERWAERVSKATSANDGAQFAAERPSQRYKNHKGSPAHRGPR